MAEDPAAEIAKRQSFQDRRFEGGDLTGADLGGKDFTACTFHGVRLPQTRWREARLEDCRFEACDLSRMAPDALGARGVVFAGCKLMGVDWSNLGAYPALSFEGCDLRYASFVGLRLRKVSFTGCNLQEAQFVETELAEAVFADCRLDGARFERCDLRKAGFAGSTGLTLLPEGNQLRGARVPVDAAIRLAESFGLKVLT
jgi:uncharacterized protein YjbI with pentapeptide repeats